MYFFGFGLLLTIISFAFFFNALGNSSVDTSIKKAIFKLILSIFGGWFIVVIITGLNIDMHKDSLVYNTIVFLTVLISPLVLHLGLQMIIYDKFKE